MSAAHTPGPWVADNNEGFSPWAIWSRMSPTGNGTPGPKIATVIGDSAETDANASLIAAAPELLEACEAMVSWIYGDYKPDSIEGQAIEKGRAAIAKATGTTP